MNILFNDLRLMNTAPYNFNFKNSKVLSKNKFIEIYKHNY